MRLEVPLFQRQYVWSREQQWELLWEDISRKFAEYLEGRATSHLSRTTPIPAIQDHLIFEYDPGKG
ncbi:DUF262 domain-containing protein [Deltaproteobacteria bacterium TL4]